MIQGESRKSFNIDWGEFGRDEMNDIGNFYAYEGAQYLTGVDDIFGLEWDTKL